MTTITTHRRTIGLAVGLAIVSALFWLWSSSGDDAAKRSRDSDLDSTMQRWDQYTMGRRSRTSRNGPPRPIPEPEPTGISESNGTVSGPPSSLAGEHIGPALDGVLSSGGSMDSAEEPPEEIQHLGDEIDPDDYTAITLPDENPEEIRHIGEFIDPDADPGIDSEP